MRNTALALASVMALSLTVPAAASDLTAEARESIVLGASGEVGQALLEKKFSIYDRDAEGNTAVMLCARFNFEKSNMDALIAAGSELNDRNNAGMTVLHIACSYNENQEVIEALCAAGADPNAIDANGKTPLHWAAEWTNPEVMRVLIRYGANIFALDGQMMTVRDYARASGIQYNIEETEKMFREALEKQTMRISGMVRKVGAVNG